ncbi:MAG TPA: hypothetical protein VJ749_10740 [Pyrinomonadaceae bacterium]|nr:hypothetical protein [Pyrinomonadaceae bacterium]
MKKSASIACVVFVLVSFPVASLGCTTFCLAGAGEVLFGRNYDWIIGDGLVIVNKRGVVKQATIVESNNAAKWVSKYGSIPFNQYGRENPAGGMNEAGLVVEQLWLDETEYPEADARPALGTQEWVQYLLDTSGTVYDQKRGRIYFRTLKSPQIKWIDMKSFDYACGTSVKIFDVNSSDAGDVTAKFADYTRQANRVLIERSFNGTDFLRSIPPAVRTYLASYPESFKCRQ